MIPASKKCRLNPIFTKPILNWNLSYHYFVFILVIEQGGILKHHLHKIINFDQKDTVKIVLNGKAFVAFMDDKNYERYIGDFEYDYFGTEVEESPFIMAPPSEGRWHLVIEQTDIPADMEVHVQIVSDL